MRFVSVTFRNFGPFAEQSLDLSAGNYGLHMIFGPNEAGKSSALRGLRYFLFGFPDQVPDNFVFKYNQFRIHARLANKRGEILDCVRRKANKDTLRASDDNEKLSEDNLQALVGGLNDEQFDLLFGLDLKLLEKGGQLIAGGESNLGEALFAAGAGLAGSRELGRQLDDRKDTLFKRKGYNQPIADSLRKLHNLKDKERESTLVAEIYAAKEEEFRIAKTTAERDRNARNIARLDLGHLQRYRSALPTISQLHTARERLRDVQTARVLSAGFENEHRNTVASLNTAETTVKNRTSDIANLEADISALVLPGSVLAEEQAVKELTKPVAVWSQQKDEAIKADTRKREMEAKARDIFRELAGSTDLEKAKAYRLRLEESNRIRQLTREFQRIDAALTNCRDQVGEFAEGIAAIETKVAQMPQLQDPSALRSLVDSVAAEGPLEDQLRRQTEACDRERTAIRNALARMTPACAAPIEDLVALPHPSEEAVKQHGQELVNSGRELELSREALLREREGLFALDRRLAAFQHGETVPSETELITARHDRGMGLKTVRQRLIGEHSPVDESQFIARYAPGRQLIDAFEASVHHCDQLADRLRHEAGRVVQWHALQAENDEKHKLIPLLETDVQKKKEVFDWADTNWRSIWERAGIATEAPGVMQDWINQFVRLRERIEKWLESKHQCDLLGARIEKLRRQIGDALPSGKVGDSLRRDLELARTQVKDLDDARDARKTLIGELERLRGAAVQANLKVGPAEAARN